MFPTLIYRFRPKSAYGTGLSDCLDVSTLRFLKTCSKSNKAVNMNNTLGSTLRFLKTCSKSNKAVNMNNTLGSTLRFLKTYCSYCLTVPFGYYIIFI